MSARHDAARAMLAAREALQQSRNQLERAAYDYAAAEEAFLKTTDSVGGVEATYPPNLLIDGVLIMPAQEWYEEKPGARVSYHTVEVAA